MLENRANRPAKDLPTVNTSPQIHLSYLFQCLLFCMLIMFQNCIVEVSVTKTL